MWRLFVAVEVPRVTVAGIREPRDASPMHVTLKFLGDVEEGRVSEIARALGEALSGTAGGPATLQGVGVFPSAERPRVLWVGVGEGKSLLTRLGDQVENALSGLGFPREDRPFHPHVTLARIHDRRGADEARRVLAENYGRLFAAFEIREVLLKRSVLAPGGAEHTTLVAIPLRAADA